MFRWYVFFFIVFFYYANLKIIWRCDNMDANNYKFNVGSELQDGPIQMDDSNGLCTSDSELEQRYTTASELVIVLPSSTTSKGRLPSPF